MGVQKKRSKNRMKHLKIGTAVVIIGCVLVIGGITCFNYKNRKERSTEQSDYVAETQDTDSLVYEGNTYRYNDHLSNFLFMGIDKRGTMDSGSGQADAIFLASWDRVAHSLKLFSIPRDTMTEIQIYSNMGRDLGKSRDHLSLAHAYGDDEAESCKLVKEAVSELFFGIPIQGYCSIGMDGIPILTESVGGLTVTVPDDSLEEQYPEFKKGTQVTLTKENTETFVRYRDIKKNSSAMVRQERQKVFLNAYAAKASEMALKDASFITDMYTAMEPYMFTNMGNDIFAKISQDMAGGGSKETCTIPGESVVGKSYDEYHVDEEALYSLVIQNFYKKVS